MVPRISSRDEMGSYSSQLVLCLHDLKQYFEEATDTKIEGCPYSGKYIKNVKTKERWLSYRKTSFNEYSKAYSLDFFTGTLIQPAAFSWRKESYLLLHSSWQIRFLFGLAQRSFNHLMFHEEWNPLLTSLNARLTTQMCNPLRKVAKAP